MLLLIIYVCRGEDNALSICIIFIKPIIEGALRLPCENGIGVDSVNLLTRVPWAPIFN